MTLEQWVREVNAAEVGGVQAAEFVHMAGVAAQHNAKRKLVWAPHKVLDAMLDAAWNVMSDTEWYAYNASDEPLVLFVRT